MEENQINPANTRSRRLPFWVIILAFVLLIAFLAMMFKGLQRAQSGPITVGSQVPAFSLTTFDGQSINTADYAGQVLVLNFWASWCKPCEQEAAELEEAWKMYEPTGQVKFIGIDWVDTEPEARAYLEKFSITFPNGQDLGTKISQQFRIQGVPETYIVDQTGKLVYVKKGPFLSVSEITTVIDGLLD